MEAVLKIGGSLVEDPVSLFRLSKELSDLAKTHRIVVVPGGGEFADIVRRLDKTYELSKTVAHKLAILAMDQYGLFLSEIIPASYVSHDIEEISNSVKGTIGVFLPSKLMFLKDPLEHSWDVTSDSITAYIASMLDAKKFVLVTDVDGIFSDDPNQNMDAKCIKDISVKELLGWNKRTCVDKTLPKILLETNLDCFVVNGKHPERIKYILENKQTLCTHVTT